MLKQSDRPCINKATPVTAMQAVERKKARAVRFKESGVVSHDPPESVCVRCAQTNTGTRPAAVEITHWNKGKRREGRGAGNKVI